MQTQLSIPPESQPQPLTEIPKLISSSKPKLSVKNLGYNFSDRHSFSSRSLKTKKPQAQGFYSSRDLSAKLNPYTTTEASYSASNLGSKASIGLEKAHSQVLELSSAILPSASHRLSPEIYQKGLEERFSKIKGRYAKVNKPLPLVRDISVENIEKPEINNPRFSKKTDIAHPPSVKETYSIKYFGVKDNIFSLVSSRLPIEKMSINDVKAAKYDLQGQGKKEVQRLIMEGSQDFMEQEGPVSPIISKTEGANFFSPKTLEIFTGRQRDKDPDDIVVIEKLVGGLTERRQSDSPPSHQHQNHHMRRYNTEGAESPELGLKESTKFVLVPLANKPRLVTQRTMTDPDESKESLGEMKGLRFGSIKSMNRQDRSNTAVIGVKSFLPRNMQIFKKKDNKAIQEQYMSAVRGLPLAQSQAISSAEEVQNIKIAPLCLGRHVMNNKGKQRKEYQDELNIPERFRTHEVRTLMAKKAQYSYSRLLSNVYSSENPEDMVIQNTRKLEELKRRRIQMKQEYNKIAAMKDKRQSPKKVYISDNQIGVKPEDYVFNEKGEYCIKVTEPAQNPLYNNFKSIREKVSSYPSNS